MTDLRQDGNPGVPDSRTYKHCATRGGKPLRLHTKVLLPLSQRRGLFLTICLSGGDDVWAPALLPGSGNPGGQLTPLGFLQVQTALTFLILSIRWGKGSSPDVVIRLFPWHDHKQEHCFLRGCFRWKLGQDWGQGQLHSCVTSPVTQEPRACFNALLVLALKFFITLCLNLWSLKGQWSTHMSRGDVCNMFLVVQSH